MQMLIKAGILAFGLLMPALAQAQVKLGVAVPITGSSASFGTQIRNGAELAIEDINSSGGINGQKLELIAADDGSDPKQGVSVANKLVTEGVKAVIGHFNSGVSIPASTIYEEAEVLQITPGSTNPQFTERKLWNTFRTCGRDDQQGSVAGKYLAYRYSHRRVAVVHDKSPYGKGIADETKKAMNSNGLTEVLYEGINPGEKDYSALVSKLKQASIDVIYFGGLYTEAGLIIRQMRDQVLNARLMGGDGIISAEFVSIAGPGAEGTLMTFSPDPRRYPSAAEVVRRFKARQFEPEAYTLYAYAAVQVYAAAARRAATFEGKRVADVMRSGESFPTVIGDLSFDRKGDITRPDYIVYEWKKGSDGRVDYTGNEITF
ncbi:branched-chain amino acid ABC transporter substrate-binding protein (plasmid) [Microvirga terrae]|uniref:Branched-chain amino acid ABC transporter substrate-binding protein n=1 Tax=Microvirga terrae TaxID=2740529 RepID=A0ABY5RZ85_9HYPH|nr:branched-chain amino acid ABC transporter substrate-binding protein [Microvirga terrae]UVF22565.1 branched-chain amino acid ABC transporter substrate-binding protein [Microvirga terrae]